MTFDQIPKLSDKELHRMAQQFGSNARKWQRQFASLLPEIARRQLFKKYGCLTVYEYAKKLCGMMEYLVDEILNVNKRLADKPAIIGLMPEQGWSKLKIVSTVATVENQKFWAEKIRNMSRNTLATFIQELRRQQEQAQNRVPGYAQRIDQNQQQGFSEGQAQNRAQGREQDNSQNRAYAGQTSAAGSCGIGGAVSLGDGVSFGGRLGAPAGFYVNSETGEILSGDPSVVSAPSGRAESGEFDNKNQNSEPNYLPQPDRFQGRLFTNYSEVEQFGTGFCNQMEASQKEAFTIRLKVETETKLRIFKQQLEKQRHEPQDWDQVIAALTEIAESTGKVKTKNGAANIAHTDIVCGGSENNTNENITDTGAKNTQEATPKIKAGKPELTKEQVQASLPQISTRPIPAKVDKFLDQEYKGKCGYPNCKWPAEIKQHTRRFALVPNHDPDFIVPLCKNHERIAHHGLIKNEESRPINANGQANWSVQPTADKSSPKFQIDQIVNKYRRPG